MYCLKHAFVAVPPIAAMLLCASCSSFERLFTNRSYVKHTLVTLPSGDEISGVSATTDLAGWANTHSARPDDNRSFVLWERGGEEKELLEIKQPGFQLPDRAESETHVAPGGNHVWLTRLGKTYASFDFDQALAIFGDTGHPAWAVGSSR